MKTLIERFESKYIPEPNTGCWLWIACSQKEGYGRLLGWNGGNILAHRLSWILNRGDIPDGKFVLHSCDTPDCVNPDHLYIGTKQDNANDKVLRGRCSDVSGAKNPRSKLKEKDVRFIKNNLHMSDKELSMKFNVSCGAIWFIRSGRHWRCVE